MQFAGFNDVIGTLGRPWRVGDLIAHHSVLHWDVEIDTELEHAAAALNVAFVSQ